AVAPTAVVAVHGPSDVTWCDRHSTRAKRAHASGAGNLVAATDGLPLLLISTDNVFDGRRRSNGESETTAPANAYGHAKLAAEEAVLASGRALVLRVSLVYGWNPDGLRPDFLTACVSRLRAGLPVAAPFDHWNTPVAVDDVAAWSAALLPSGRAGVLHLGGPQRLSRYEWARRIAAELDVDPGLVRPVAKAESAYACRPDNACLHSEIADELPELRGMRPMSVEVGTRLAAARAAAGHRRGPEATSRY
ncbi:SDR family oxidoreductase, partial [Streptomyces zhihengii]|uniref:SDR family oxidoreductase n=1 Tax=Streptomyces zhihengii TaxID=1818004 RepID=UPI0033B2760A